jgi:DNA-binding NarL/FixJ family response regulator
MASQLGTREALDCLKAGAAGVILKHMAPGLFVECVRKVAAGGVWLERQSFSEALEHVLRREAGSQSLGGKLTNRELEVARLCARGASNKEIGADLYLSTATVKSHLHQIYKKLDVNGRAGLTSLAHEIGLV